MKGEVPGFNFPEQISEPHHTHKEGGCQDKKSMMPEFASEGSKETQALSLALKSDCLALILSSGCYCASVCVSVKWR